MRSGINGGRSRRRASSVLALAASTLVLTMACGRADVPDSPAASSAAAVPVAPEAARIGAPGSACELPVTLGIAESWKPKAVIIAPDNPLAELARQGPLTTVCEIDAKPAGNIGFLRVWTGDAGELRPTLDAFLGTDASEPVFTELRIGDRPALEVTYQEKSALDDEMKPRRAFALETAQGIVAVSLGGSDSEEHEEMLPAYELAKTSLTVTG